MLFSLIVFVIHAYGWVNGQKVGGWMNKLDGQVNGVMHGWIDDWMNKRMGGGRMNDVNGQMDGNLDRWENV